MQRDDILVEVRDRDLVRVGTITAKYLDLKASVRFRGVGEWSLRLPGDHPMVPYLNEEGSGIICYTRGADTPAVPPTWGPGVESRRNRAKNSGPASSTGWSPQSGGATWTSSAQAVGGPLDEVGATWYRMLNTAANTTSPVGFNAMPTGLSAAPVVEGETIIASLYLITSESSGAPRMGGQFYSATGAVLGGEIYRTNDPIDAEVWKRVDSGPLVVPAGAAFFSARVRISTSAGKYQPGSYIGGAGVLIESGSALLPWFNGNTPSDTVGPGVVHSWAGVSNNSESIEQALIVTDEGSPAGVNFEAKFSGPTSTPKRKADRENPDGTYTYDGVTDEIHLTDARAFPSPEVADPGAQTRANDTRQGAAETIMRQYVGFNIANGAAVTPAQGWAPAGRLRGARLRIVLQDVNLGRGAVVAKSPRFQNLLELLVEIATLAGLGFRLIQRDRVLVFEVFEPQDRRDLVRLDLANGTLTSEEIEVGPPSVTEAIVAGQGEGTDRTIISRRSAESIAAEATWGRVIELFVDQRDTDELAELEQSGDEKLIEGGFTATNVKVIPADDQTMRYSLDWNEGDLITVVVNGQETESIVSEAAILINSTACAVGAAIGDVTGFDPDNALVKRVDDIEARTSAIERSVEVPLQQATQMSDVVGLIAALAGKASASELDDAVLYFSDALRALIPAGNVEMTARSTAPAGWLLCDGAAISRTTYADLFAAIGTTYGTGNGTTTFNVPNPKGRVVVGRDAANTKFDTLGETGGAETVTLTSAQSGLPAHTHTLLGTGRVLGESGGAALANLTVGGGSYGLENKGTNANTAANAASAHENLPPYIAMNYIIKT